MPCNGLPPVTLQKVYSPPPPPSLYVKGVVIREREHTHYIPATDECLFWTLLVLFLLL